MKKHEIFENNPDLKEVHMTSDGQAFYNDNDAKMHARTLEDKTVELVVNPSNYDNLLDDLDDDKDDDAAKAIGKKFIDILKDNAGAFVDSLGNNDQNDDFNSIVGYSATGLNNDSNITVADFSGEKTGEGIKEPLTEIKAEAEGSENILIEGKGDKIELENIPVLSAEQTQNVTNEATAEPASTEEKPAEEKKSNAKKGK